MKNPEAPEQNDDIAEARLSWASSFLTDWLIFQIKLNRIKTPGDIIQLRQEFPPDEAQGTDFTIHDVWVAALRLREANYHTDPGIPKQVRPTPKELDRLMELLDVAAHNPPKSEEWVQTSFLTD